MVLDRCDWPGCGERPTVYSHCVDHAPDEWIADVLQDGTIDEDDVPDRTLEALRERGAV